MTLTRAQRVALKRVYDRERLFKIPNHNRLFTPDQIPSYRFAHRVTYREFRRTVQPGPDCIMVPWCGMWLGIEPDGYTHS